MPNGKRKVMFSAKQKKQQLQQKRDQKKSTKSGARNEDSDDDDSAQTIGTEAHQIRPQQQIETRINFQPNASSSRDSNRYALQFFVENAEELKKRKDNARKPFPLLPETALEISSEEAFDDPSGVSSLDMPKRPNWDFNMSNSELEMREQKYFREYLDKIQSSNQSLSYFDLNLETWRQLWRVLEMSDIVLLIVDIRHPVFHFPPSLYYYVINDLKKHMILVLNKIDLVESPLVVAWVEYLKKRFPRLHIIPFASFAGMKLRKNKKRIGKLRMAANGAKSLLSVCEQIVGENVDLLSWRVKIEEELNEEELAANADIFDDDDDDDEVDFKPLDTASKLIEKLDLSYFQFEKFKDGVVTIGCVGHPNVGKSSLLNAIMGKKVVSVSRTPGHTKHFQTIFLTPTVRLCDCPGLVFPSRAPKELQVLMGCFPIAQLREPYSAIGYMSQRLNVINILKLQHPSNEPQFGWSAYDICEAWAIKRGYYTAKAARPDVYRAANQMLRMALDGRTLCLAFYPPNYTKEKSHWKNHANLRMIESIQGQKLDFSDDENKSKQSSKNKPINENQTSEDETESEDGEESEVNFVSNSKFALLQECE